MTIPIEYFWLHKEDGPSLLKEGLRLIGINEYPGTLDNPVILSWAKEIGSDVADFYKKDSTPWCGLFMAIAAKRSGWPFPSKPLWALNWAKFGNASPAPMLGDVLTFKRDGGGHVGIYIGEDDEAFHVLGGNQSDSVSITRIARSRLYKARRCAWRIKQPRNVRRIFLSPRGSLSRNEV